MLKAFIFFSIFIFALVVESRPSSNLDIACVDCNTKEIVSRTRRDAEGVLNSVSGLVGNILHQNWMGIERVEAAKSKRPIKNIYIGNGRNNKNKVYINRRRDEYDEYDEY